MQDLIDRERDEAHGCLVNAYRCKRAGNTAGVKFWAKEARKRWHYMLRYSEIV